MLNTTPLFPINHSFSQGKNIVTKYVTTIRKWLEHFSICRNTYFEEYHELNIFLRLELRLYYLISDHKRW